MIGAKSFTFEPVLCDGPEQPPERLEQRSELKPSVDSGLSGASPSAAHSWGRNQKDSTGHFRGVARGMANHPNDEVVHGEIVALDENSPAPTRSPGS